MPTNKTVREVIHGQPKDIRGIALHRLYEGETIVLAQTDGNETLVNAKKVFTGFIDPNLKKWKTDQISYVTRNMVVNVYELCENARFDDMFGSLGVPYKFVMTQGQIIQFCIDHSDKLRTDGYETFFLFRVNTKNGSEYFVASVCLGARGLEVYINRFDDKSFWRRGYIPRVVVPQL